MHAVIVLIGDELLAGHTRDANGHYLAGRLAGMGHRVRRIITVPDEWHAITEAVEMGFAKADFVLVSGGLGPTHDDRTTEALSRRFNRRVVVDEASWKKLVERYGKRYPDGVPTATEGAARRMVSVPEGSEVLDNPLGAAPGYILREGHRWLAVMPGVPAELQAIFEQRLVGHFIPTGASTTLLEIEVHLPEAEFADALGAIADRYPDVDIGSYPHFGEPHVTLRFRGEHERAQKAVDAFYERVPEAK